MNNCQKNVLPVIILGRLAGIKELLEIGDALFAAGNDAVQIEPGNVIVDQSLTQQIQQHREVHARNYPCFFIHYA